jgi:hypothetical protein
VASGERFYLVPERKLSFTPISASGSNFNPRNTQEIVDFKVLIRYKKASTKMEEVCLMGFSGGSE